MRNEFTGKHAFFIALAAFATIIAANLAMLFAATGSFPGLVVANSYIASQDWDRKATAQSTLGWSAGIGHADGRVRVTLRDRHGEILTRAAPRLRIGRPTTTADDREITPTFDGTAWSAPLDLPQGRWRVEISVDDPASYTASAILIVDGTD